MSKDDYKEENNKKETRQPEPYVYSSLEELFAAFGEPEQPVLHEITLQDLWPEKTEQSDKPVTYGLQDPADQPEQPEQTEEPEPEKPAPHGLTEPDEEPEI